jgi:hypothetical protein
MIVLYLLFAIAVCTTAYKIWRARRDGRSEDDTYIAWGELLFYVLGVQYVIFGVMHAYFQSLAAPSIGWQPSPFEYELGWLEIPLGVVALASLWRGFEFRLAATIMYATFAFAAAAQHLQEVLCCHNYAPNNAGPVLWFADLVLPGIAVVLAAMSAARRRA